MMNATLLALTFLCVAAEPAETATAAETMLYVRTTPAGAEVRLNKERLGTSDDLFPVKAGTYKLVVELDGYESEEQPVVVRDGEITRIELTLKPLAEAAESQGQTDSPMPTDTQNLLKNAGFEAGDKVPDDWQQGAAIPGVKYAWDRHVAMEGKASVAIEKKAQRYFPVAQWSQTVDRQGDQTALLVSAQVKAKNMTKATLDVVFLNADGQWISHSWVAYIGAKEDGDPPADHDWKLYSGKVTIPPETKRMAIGLQVYGPGKVWFDDVRAAYTE